ncbi:MAG: winged helix-turn-helix transcriptional regulator [Patescibacteria group bacterium]
MADEAQTPPADTQAPSPSEPVPAPEPVSAPAESPPQAEATPAPTEPQPEVTADALVSVIEPQAEIQNPPPPQTAVPPLRKEELQNSTPTTTVIRPHGDLAIARAKIQDTKRKKLDKIMSRLSEKGRITNDEVEKLLHVSDATATRYLQALEKENRIKQVGATGKAVWYGKI